ncbi:hypothetical protein GLYMA_01G212300v4 [Glycine max]|nr:hypothetical protein GLYMA_01G212300v4 [Glycine max]KAH1164196.1 hypothetical protein GYH30_002300 [Glycine max]
MCFRSSITSLLLTCGLKAIDAFLEELIVRRELADNYCFYQPHYDSLKGAWAWAQNTLIEHATDKREHIYTREQLEKTLTADPLWNASQLETVHYGKMHGFTRMYWAKKILEWTRGPEEALEISLYLNDKYELDGRDPNGYVGCMWSICGVHDQVRLYCSHWIQFNLNVEEEFFWYIVFLISVDCGNYFFCTSDLRFDNKKTNRILRFGI